MLINIYTANHGKTAGIEDYLVFLHKAFGSRGHQVRTSTKLDPASVNIIIDEFTNSIRNLEICDFRKSHPDVKIYFLLTEFIESRLLVRSLNFFGGLLEASYIAALDLFVRLQRKDYRRPKLRQWAVALIYAPIIMPYLTLILAYSQSRRDRWNYLKGKLLQATYLHLRYLGLERMTEVADGFILTHDANAQGITSIAPRIPILGGIYPEFDLEEVLGSLFLKKELFLVITGSITPYRQKWIQKVNNRILTLGVHHLIEKCKAIPFNSSNNIQHPGGAYALHPPQNCRWKYCSPTRIYRSLVIDHSMPILTKHFGQHPIEDICLVYAKEDEFFYSIYQYFDSPKSLSNYLEPKLIRYLQFASEKNDAMINAINSHSSVAADHGSL